MTNFYMSPEEQVSPMDGITSEGCPGDCCGVSGKARVCTDHEDRLLWERLGHDRRIDAETGGE